MRLVHYRVQGFPDSHTRIKLDSKATAEHEIFKHCTGGYHNVPVSKEREIVSLLALHGQDVTIIDEKIKED